MMHAVIAAIFAVGLAGPAAAEPAETLELRVGEPAEIALEANPTTGYQWRIDEDASEGLDKLDITDLGTGEPESKRLGAPTVHRWRLAPRAPGSARLELIYLRAWEDKPPRRRQSYDITITN